MAKVNHLTVTRIGLESIAQRVPMFAEDCILIRRLRKLMEYHNATVLHFDLAGIETDEKGANT